MLHEVTAIESRRTELKLTVVQAQALLVLGRELAAGQAWWGDEPEATPKSVIDAVRLSDNSYAVTFRDVIGVVRLGDVQVRIRPKIPESHFSHLVANSSLVPRTSASSAAINEGDDYASLIASWCVTEAEALLRRGLRSDYIELNDELSEVRGRMDTIATSLAIQSGRLVAVCDFEEFSDDFALNRVVKAACQLIVGTPELANDVRRRAHRVTLRMSAVGELRHGDRHTRVARLTRSYERVLPLAHLVLKAAGLAPRVGTLSGRAFLIRTPELIEDALRRILSVRLTSNEVRKRRLSIGASGFTMNPDLVFDGGRAVADIKYRFLSDKWHRASLYQAIAFAAALRSRSCAILGFTSGSMPPPAVPVGDIVARSFAWNASTDAEPAASEDFLVDEVTKWLADVNEKLMRLQKA